MAFLLFFMLAAYYLFLSSGRTQESESNCLPFFLSFLFKILCAAHTTEPFLTEDKIRSCLILGLFELVISSLTVLVIMLSILLPPIPT